MSAFLKQDLKRAVMNKGFFVAVLLIHAIFIHAIRINTNFEGNPSTYEIISVAMSLSGFSPFAAVFPVLSYSVSFCEEYRSGYLRMITARTDWKRYGWIRILSTGLSGGIIIALPFAVVCTIGYVLGIHGTEGLTEGGLYYGTRMWYYLEQYGDWYILVGKVLLGFLFGVLWALVGMAFAIWFCNRYVALLAPFILYEIMWIMLYNIPFLNPVFLFKGDNLESYPLSGFIQLIYIVITVCIVWLGLRKRVHDE
ncbi:MAG: hypothetical protein HDR22_04290 [Lachnospiraceae bacterium]|nr:hypothetical protein [Lachnospiraceae bacterium]